MRAILCVMVASFCLLSVGCAMRQAPVIPPVGLVFSDYSAPLDLEFHATPNTNLKTGQSELYNYIGLVTTGDASVKAAAQIGGITKIEYADYHFFSVLGIYNRYTTIVYGE